jgi:hypothetical protein
VLVLALLAATQGPYNNKYNWGCEDFPASDASVVSCESPYRLKINCCPVQEILGAGLQNKI